MKGPGWWHFTGVGHFFNSIHLWAVELFFFFMVIHLWGKYWMAAWRGGRARVWMTGAVSFIVAVPCALTGYVSQQNFDAQWIATQAKDGLNAAGVGAFFNVTNFGQMYSYHVLLLPLAVVALVAAHVLLVRKHGIVPPFTLADHGSPVSQSDSTLVPESVPALSPALASGHRPEPVPASAHAPALGAGHGPAPDAPRGARPMSRDSRRSEDQTYREWKGAYRPYDILREATIALGVVLALALLLTILFSSPDLKPSTVQSVVAWGPGRFRYHGHDRARWVERNRQLRAAVQPRR